MTAPALEYVLRVTFDRALCVEAATVTTYVDERQMYRVEIVAGPFDTLSEILERVKEVVATQLALW